MKISKQIAKEAMEAIDKEGQGIAKKIAKQSNSLEKASKNLSKINKKNIEKVINDSDSNKVLENLVNRTNPVKSQVDRELMKQEGNIRISNIQDIHSAHYNRNIDRDASKSITRNANKKTLNKSSFTERKAERMMNNKIYKSENESVQQVIDNSIQEKANKFNSRLAAEKQEAIDQQKLRKNFNEKKLEKNKFNSKTDYAKYKQHSAYKEASEAFEKKNYDNPLLKAISSENNIEAKDLNAVHISKSRQKAILNASSDDLGLRDLSSYYKVPQKAVGVAGTAWLVSRLASSGGEQTNSQLYGQQSL